MRFAFVPGAVLLVLATLAGGAWWVLAPTAEPTDAPMAALPLPPHPPRIIVDATYDSCLDLLPEDPPPRSRWCAPGSPGAPRRRIARRWP